MPIKQQKVGTSLEMTLTILLFYSNIKICPVKWDMFTYVFPVCVGVTEEAWLLSISTFQQTSRNKETWFT